MKINKFYYLLGGGVILLSLISLVLVKLKNYYTIAEFKPTNFTNRITDDTLRIAFIGDSWAEMHPVDSLQVAADRWYCNRNVKCKVSGVGGAKSKAIYYNLLCDDQNENPPMYYHPYKDALTPCPDYCVVSVGINDAATKMGADFYVEHTMMVVNLLLMNDIVPVIIEIPMFDEVGQYDKLGLSKKALRRVSMLLSNSSICCVSDYRKALENQLTKNKETAYIYIKSEEWCPQGYKDTRSIWRNDNLHLNNDGYHVLDSCIAKKIFEYENRL